MTEDGLVSKWNVAAGVAWAAVVGFIVAAWAVFLGGENWPLAGMLAFSACATSAAAAVLHVRGYFVRLCRVVRLTNGLGQDEPVLSGRPRSVR